MTKIRISIVNFLNTPPIVWGFTDGPLQDKYELSFTVPSMCAETLRAGQVDVEYQRINDFVMLPEMDISATHCLNSVFPPASLHLGVRPLL